MWRSTEDPGLLEEDIEKDTNAHRADSAWCDVQVKNYQENVIGPACTAKDGRDDTW